MQSQKRTRKNMNSDLEEQVLKLTENLSLNDLKKARDNLTIKYRDVNRHGKAKHFMTTDLERLSYLVTRFPATYAVNYSVLENVKALMPDLTLKDMLDLGSGPGTAFFAANELFPEMSNALLTELDNALIELGKSLQKGVKSKTKVDWISQDITNLNDLKKHDLVTISYALNELNELDRAALITKAFHAANKVILIIEPGTKEGFEIIREVRKQLISLNGHMIAPCPHALACPMPENDWCHFSKRLPRTSMHRMMKDAQLGYEDEKFSYVAFSKTALKLPVARILRHPEKHSGHLKLFLCTKSSALEEKTISKRDGELYKQARKLEWGDCLPFSDF